MKKILILCSVLFGLATTGLLAEDAVVTLPAPSPTAPVAATAPATNATQGTAPSGKKHHHNKPHKRKIHEVTPSATTPKS
jgi:hypothetical protein